MNKKYLGIVAGLLLLAGCSNDETFTEKKAVDDGVKTFTSFTATLDDVAGTRAFLGDADAMGNKKRVFWEGFEKIRVYSDMQTEPVVFYPDQLNDDNTLTFKGPQITGKKFYALCPSNKDWIVDEQNPEIVHYLLQNDCSFNGIDEEVNDVVNYDFVAPMVAVSTDNNFTFKQITSGIHVTIDNLSEIESAFIISNNGEPLLGDGYVDLSQDTPVFVIDGDCDNMTGYWSDWFDSYDMEGTQRDIYFFIPPTTLENGFTLEVYGYDEFGNEVSIKKQASAKLEAKVGIITHYALVDFGAELEIVMQGAMAKYKDALKKFYDALGGDNWGNNDNWNTDAPLNEWYGLKFEWGELVGIDLSYNGLRGAIPAEITQFDHLRQLELYGNNITSLPANFGDLQSLEHLDLEANQLDAFPEQLLELPNLRVLWLNDMGIEGPLPEGLTNLTNLTDLYLQGNHFEGEIPATFFTNLTNLNTLDLRWNSLTGTITEEMQQSEMWQHTETLKINPQEDGPDVTIENGITEIRLNVEELTMKVGEEFQFEATVTPTNTIKANNVRWEYQWDGNEICDTDDTGHIIARRAGKFTVWAKSNDGTDVAASCEVTIIQ